MSWLCSADDVNVLVNTLQSEADRCLGSVLLRLTTLHRYKAMLWCTG